MRQIIWSNFAISELKNIFLYYKLVADEKTANKIKKSIFSATKCLLKQPFIGAIEENLLDLEQGHRYLIKGNYKIVYKVIDSDIFITDVFDCRQNPAKLKRFTSEE
jgi:toxin ParE1/3/4